MSVERKDRKGSNMGTHVQRNWEPPSACAHWQCTAAESDGESSEETDTDVETADAAVQVNIGGRRNRRGKGAGQKEGHEDA